MPKFEVVPLAELKSRVSAELIALVDDVKGDIGKLCDDQGGRYKLEKGDDVKQVRKAIRLAAGSMNRQVRFAFRGEEGTVSFYLAEQAKRRGRPRKVEAAAPKPGARKRGRPRKVAS